MKKFLLGIAAVFTLLAVVVVAERPSIGAQPEGNAQTDPMVDLGPDNDIYKAGLWREGKATDTDWKFLDILWKAPFRRGYRPTQPIAYSHRVHMEKNGMECQYCHSGVTKSNFATVPSVELCMGCHKAVKTESPEIKKLKDYYDKGQPVPWEPVNNLPEHVRFPHKRHLKAGVGCQNCHGQVQKMTVVEKVSSLKMGFCVSCHREKGASIDCSACHY
ncbi:MAG: cytochrome c3 family protein [Bdellovibrionota bacterium]